MKKEFNYHGFESFYDFYRDMEEIFEPWNKEFSELDGEFQNTIKVTVEVLPLEKGAEKWYLSYLQKKWTYSELFI